MIVVLQRVANASITIDSELHATISHGMLVLLGVSEDDNLEDANYICSKLLPLRIFADTQGKMNLSVVDVAGEVLLISQFTLLANTQKGNRPSYFSAAKPDVAVPLYEHCIKQLNDSLGNKLKTGVFGADMKVSLLNDGPVTIIINSKDRK